MRCRPKTIRALVLVGLTYAVLWFVTAWFGGRHVRNLKLSTMYQPMGLSGFTDVSDGSSAQGPWYYCRTLSYAPFLIRVDYGWHTGGLSGDGGSELYWWAFVRAIRVYEIGHWAE